MNLEKAIKIAVKCHKGQKDKGGKPYILHPLHVMNNVSSEDEKIVAILHDVIEDANYPIEDLKKEGFKDQIIEALVYLTHDKKVDYFAYIEKIKDNALAKTVKIQDLKHNLDVTRLESLDESAVNNLKKYFMAYKILTK